MTGIRLEFRLLAIGRRGGEIHCRGRSLLTAVSRGKSIETPSLVKDRKHLPLPLPWIGMGPDGPMLSAVGPQFLRETGLAPGSSFRLAPSGHRVGSDRGTLILGRDSRPGFRGDQLVSSLVESA